MGKFIWILSLFAVMAAGCTGCGSTNKKIDTITPLGNAITKAEVYVGEAAGDVVKAKPHADASGKIHLDSATSSLTGAAKEIKTATADLAIVKKQNDEMKAEITSQNEMLDNYHHRWIGDLTYHWGKIIIASWLVIGIGGMLLKTFTGGWLASIGGGIMHFIPASNIFVWVGKWIVSRKG